MTKCDWRLAVADSLTGWQSYSPPEHHLKFCGCQRHENQHLTSYLFWHCAETDGSSAAVHLLSQENIEVPTIKQSNIWSRRHEHSRSLENSVHWTYEPTQTEGSAVLQSVSRRRGEGQPSHGSPISLVQRWRLSTLIPCSMIGGQITADWAEFFHTCSDSPPPKSMLI